jgi:beta-glucanase (GH16 family)
MTRTTAWAAAFACCIVTASAVATAPRAGAEPVDVESFSSETAGLSPYLFDEFDGPEGQPPNPRLWNIRTGGGGWGNSEKQEYTADAKNVRLDGAGNMVIEARADGGRLTSARIDTLGHADLRFGVIAARIKMPQGQGLHPAFWMLGNSLGSVGYPGSGEIDIIEIVNDARRGYFSAHGPMNDPTEPKWKLSTNIVGGNLATGFHTYWLSKQPGHLVIGIDEAPLATLDMKDLPAGANWVQDAPFFALLNLAVAGEWPGPLDLAVLPAQMLVDWVRFY